MSETDYLILLTDEAVGFFAPLGEVKTGINGRTFVQIAASRLLPSDPGFLRFELAPTASLSKDLAGIVLSIPLHYVLLVAEKPIGRTIGFGAPDPKQKEQP